MTRPTCRRRAAPPQGFSLIDGLVGMTLMAVGLLGLARLESGLIAQSTEAQNRLAAAQLGDQLLSTVLVDVANASCYTVPAAAGQAVLMVPATPGLCTVRSVTATTAAGLNAPQLISFGATGAYNKMAFTTAPAYAARARLTVLGTLQWHRYRVVDGNLVMEQPLAGTSNVLVRNVMAFRAEYGVSSAAGVTTLASWQAADTAGWGSLSNSNIGRVRALRLGLVVRSAQRDKPDASGSCTASDSKPALFGATVEPDLSDWACYRYRSVTLVVPLRNMVWGQAS
jgi:type IV pilus assembly protein PilW